MERVSGGTGPPAIPDGSIDMTDTTIATTARGQCDPADRVTRSLLGYGVLAGPFYVVTALAQALTRDGFDLARHQWSLLVNGDLGWIQVANFVLTGLMVVAFAVGLRRSLAPGRASRWSPVLVGAYGVSLVAAGLFRADPALGFPAGTPDGPAAVSWHGLAHFVAGGIGFACVAVACFVLARRYAAEGRRGFAAFSRVTAIAFLAGFAMIASSGGSPVATVAFTATVILIWAWLRAVALDRYRTVGTAPAPAGL